MKKLTIFSLVIVLSAVMFVTGCDWTKKETNTTTATEEDNTALPSEDAIGEDMSEVPRYEDSVRTYYLKDSEETDITYVTKEEAEDVRDYYKDLLSKQGWTLVAEASDYIDFEKGDSDNPEMFTVYFEWKSKKEQTEYELVYMPPLTEEELLELESEDDDEIDLEF